jgi:predicted Zn-dependent protease with MMP-like domain
VRENPDLDQFSASFLCREAITVKPQSMDFQTLSTWAENELKNLTKVLPADIQESIKQVSVTFEDQPGKEPYDQQLEGDELGIFEGPCADEEAGPEELPRIRLFLNNIWEWVGEDEQDFLDEVGTTFLHELGHYLGWNEEQVAARGLE